MSRRGRTTGAAISLFSFQDIITSVTAILILLVLILTLELITRSRQRGVAVEHRRVAEDLRGAVADMERRSAALRSEIATLQSAARQSAAFSVAETEARSRRAAERAREVDAEIEMLESQVRAAASARRRDEGALVAERSGAPLESAERVAAMDARAAEMEQVNQAERAKQRDAKSAKIDASAAPTLVFNMPRGATLKPQFVEVSSVGLTVMGPDGALGRRFSGTDAAFDRWLSSLDSGSQYVVVITRPSGLRFHDAVIAAIESANLRYGLELAGEAMPISLQPEGG